LVIYDISEDRKRTMLRELLRDYSLKRIQYSGFIGDIDSHDRLVLSREVERFLSGENDSIYIMPMCDRCWRLCRIVSQRGEIILDDEVTIV